MILDQLNVFFDDAAAAASMTSKAVYVSSFAGRNDATPIVLLAKGGTGQSSFTITVEESDKVDADFTPVSGSTVLTKPDGNAVMASMTLPPNTRKPYVRLIAAATGSTGDVTLFSGFTRDHVLPWTDGLYIDRGKVVA